MGIDVSDEQRDGMGDDTAPALAPWPEDDADARSGAAARLGALRRAVQSLRARGPLPIERWLMIAGGVLVIAGLPIILLGWWGASRTPYTFEQIPYLISGGLFGLALAVVGALFYFAYWLTRQVQETRRQADRTEAALKRIEDVLSSQAPSNGKAPAGTRAAPTAGRGKGNGTYVATAKGTMFHLPDCIVVIGRTDLRNVRATDPGLEPCKICDPLPVG